MSKNKSIFTCNECGYESQGWLGKCPSCSKWNSFVEEFQEVKSKATNLNNYKEIIPVNINDINIDNEERFLTGINEMDRVLGGGIVKGSLALICGDPGIGKSTLILQICENLKTNSNVLYISGEESIKQIKLRANRLNIKNPKLLMVSEVNLVM